nr:asparagine synthase C-terminal domain-containing protein [Mesorhizobium delmotii]
MEAIHFRPASPSVQIRNYRVEPATGKSPALLGNIGDDLARLLEDAVRLCISANPREVALALSGGIDSSLLAGIGSRLGLRHALTVFSAPKAKSVGLSARLTRELNLQHECIELTPEWVTGSLTRRCIFRAGCAPTLTGGRLLWYAAQRGYSSVLFGHAGEDIFLRGEKYSDPEKYVATMVRIMNSCAGGEEVKASALLSLLSERALVGSDLELLTYLSESDIARDPHEVGDELESQCLGIEISVPFLSLPLSEMLMALSPAQRMYESIGGYWQYRILRSVLRPRLAAQVIGGPKEASFSTYGPISFATGDRLQESFGGQCRSLGDAWSVISEALFYPKTGRPQVETLAG